MPLYSVTEKRLLIISSGDEKITFILTGNYPPRTFAIEDSNPRIVCDFPGVSLGREVRQVMKTNGKTVRRIRVGYHKRPKPKTRVVLDLVPRKTKGYEIQPMMFKDENVYTLVVK